MTDPQRATSVVWVASYPKSGNTWVQNVIRHAGRPYGMPDQDIDVYKLIAEGRAPQVVGGIRRAVCTEPTTVLKTHRPWRADGRLHPEVGLQTCGFVYVMRNPLDVLLSYINFTRQQYARRKESREYQQSLFIDLLGFTKVYEFDEWQTMTLDRIPRENLDHALSRYTELGTNIPVIAGTTRSTWLDHCRSWHAAAKTVKGVILRYEDLLEGAHQFYPLRKIFRFTEEQIAQAVAAVNASQRSKQGQQVFYNKMTSYYFSDYFSPDLVQRFIGTFKDQLAEFGYSNLGQEQAAENRLG